jgi:hypothetical protein
VKAFELELLPLDDSDVAVESVLLLVLVLFNKINGDKRMTEGVLEVLLLSSVSVCVVELLSEVSKFMSLLFITLPRFRNSYSLE